VQFKVPQNIDMADRIVGPLTLIQFLYLLVGGIVDYVLLNTVAPVSSTLFIAIAGPIALFSLAMAVLKIQDQQFPKFVAAFFQYLSKPKSRIWHKEGGDTNLVITPDVHEKKTAISRKVIKKSELEKLAQALDTGGKVAQGVTPAPRPISAPKPDNRLRRSLPVLDNVKAKRKGP